MSEAPDGRRVAVAMSGGVDSAVAALLLHEAGWDVFGITLKLWCYGETDSGPRSCCSLDAIEDARACCELLGIPHHVVNFEERFGEHVVDRFVDDYLSGRTPNPCVLCNQHVKFGALLDRARALGADRVATGHYARLITGPDGPRLLQGVDPDKDQSYALWAVPREVLTHTLMPVGEWTKDQIREHAHRAGLPVAGKIESQDICFVPDGDYARFVASRAPSDAPALQPGAIRDQQGQRVGRHGGVARYTVGQRRGLGIAHPEPLHVIDIDVARNELRVGSRDELLADGLVARDVNWIGRTALSGALRVRAKIRYRHPGADAELRSGADGGVSLRFDEPQSAITPGQSVVFYNGDEVLGGGVIESRSLGPGATPTN